MDRSLLAAFHLATRWGRWVDAGFQPNLVSVIVPTYNRAHFLLDCLNSVAGQSHRPIELIIVDNGSTDGTENVVEHWRDTRPRNDGVAVNYIRQEKGGANVARNRGLIESKGEFIQFLDSDDVLLPHKLERGIRSIKERNVDFAYCVVSFCDEKLNGIPGSFGLPGNGSDADITSYLWQTMCPVYSRDAVRGIGPWMESIFYADDWEYGTRVKLLGCRGYFDNTVGGLLRVYSRAERKKQDQLLREAADGFQAYRHITELATRLDRLTGELRARLANRFLIASLQFGRCGDFDHQQQALKMVVQLAPRKSLVWRIAAIWPRFPSKILPGITLSLIRRVQRAFG